MSASDQLIVRPARECDVASIVEFSLAMAMETENRTLDKVRLQDGTRALLADPAHGFFLVAELPRREESELVGQMMITYEWSDWRNGRIWWIQSVYVPPEARRGGVFRALFQHVRKLAEATPGIVGLRLYVEENNTLAHRVYRDLGMADAGYFVLQRMLVDD